MHSCAKKRSEQDQTGRGSQGALLIREAHQPQTRQQEERTLGKQKHRSLVTGVFYLSSGLPCVLASLLNSKTLLGFWRALPRFLRAYPVTVCCHIVRLGCMYTILRNRTKSSDRGVKGGVVPPGWYSQSLWNPLFSRSLLLRWAQS